MELIIRPYEIYGEKKKYIEHVAISLYDKDFYKRAIEPEYCLDDIFTGAYDKSNRKIFLNDILELDDEYRELFSIDKKEEVAKYTFVQFYKSAFMFQSSALVFRSHSIDKITPNTYLWYATNSTDEKCHVNKVGSMHDITDVQYYFNQYSLFK